MGYTPLRQTDNEPDIAAGARPQTRWTLHIGLFLLTCVSTVIAGTAWAQRQPFEITNWAYGVQYAALIMTFLAAHEFGHYFAALRHGVHATLPYFIPIPPLGVAFGVPFGTFGAVIRTRSPILTRKALFDIGVAGPLAGFVACLAFLVVGILTMPSHESIYWYHPDYRLLGGAIPTHGLHFGDTLLYSLLTSALPTPHGFLPPMNEMYHYPLLCVGWFGLFVTSLNLLPVGQLDGGHILYAMFGERQWIVGRWTWRLLFALGLGSAIGYVHEHIVYDSPDALYTFFQSLLLPVLEGVHKIAPWYYETWGGWLFWAFILRFLVRVQHPPVEDDEPLGVGRTVVGWIAIAILATSFSVNGLYDAPESQPVKPSPGNKRKGSDVRLYRPEPAAEDRSQNVAAGATPPQACALSQSVIPNSR